jgi:hypothetical protein
MPPGAVPPAASAYRAEVRSVALGRHRGARALPPAHRRGPGRDAVRWTTRDCSALLDWERPLEGHDVAIFLSLESLVHPAGTTTRDGGTRHWRPFWGIVSTPGRSSIAGRSTTTCRSTDCPLRRRDERLLIATGFAKWGLTRGVIAAPIPYRPSRPRTFPAEPTYGRDVL